MKPRNPESPPLRFPLGIAQAPSTFERTQTRPLSIIDLDPSDVNRGRGDNPQWVFNGPYPPVCLLRPPLWSSNGMRMFGIRDRLISILPVGQHPGGTLCDFGSIGWINTIEKCFLLERASRVRSRHTLLNVRFRTCTVESEAALRSIIEVGARTWGVVRQSVLDGIRDVTDSRAPRHDSAAAACEATNRRLREFELSIVVSDIAFDVIDQVPRYNPAPFGGTLDLWTQTRLQLP